MCLNYYLVTLFLPFFFLIVALLHLKFIFPTEKDTDVCAARLMAAPKLLHYEKALSSFLSL